MNELDTYANKKIKQLEAKLGYWISIVEAAVFIAVLALGLLIEYLLSGAIEGIVALGVLIIAAVAALMAGKRLWKIYTETLQEALKLVNELKR